MQFKQLIFVLCTSQIVGASPAQAVRGIYAGIRGGPVALISSDSNQGNGLGVDIGVRMTKSYDLVGQFQMSSSHPNGLSHQFVGIGGEMRLFRGMADVEMSLGVGTGMYNITVGGNSELKAGVNGGIIIDFVIDRSLHFGTMARYHSFGAGDYGSGLTMWMIRVGYYFGLQSENSLALPGS